MAGTGFVLLVQIAHMKRILNILAFFPPLVRLSAAYRRRLELRRQLQTVSEEGYETAGDVRFPHEEIRSPKLHYGPVHPGLK